MNRLSLALFVAWIIGVLIMFAFPPNDPPSAPNGVGLARGYPVHYAAPCPYSPAQGGYDGGAPPWPDTGADYTDDHEPLTYEERFSDAALGCPIARAAVAEQGVGE